MGKPISSAIERRLAGFEVASVTRVARRPRTEPVEVHPTEDLPELLPLADVVIVVAPHTPQTEGMIGSRELAAMPDGALLVNVARGKLVDTGALLAETSTGRIRAALDVTDPEPLPPEHPLWRTYVFVYADGAALLERWIGEASAPDRVGRFGRLLHEQVTPGRLLAEPG